MSSRASEHRERESDPQPQAPVVAMIVCHRVSTDRFRSMGPRFRGGDGGDYFFAAAARSTKVLPPFILWASGASLIWITTASASTPRFFTSACVMSRIMPAFCSSVRPAAMFTVISGIFLAPSLLLSWPGLSGPSTSFAIKQDVDARDKPGHDAQCE